MLLHEVVTCCMSLKNSSGILEMESTFNEAAAALIAMLEIPSDNNCIAFSSDSFGGCISANLSIA